MLLVVAVIRNQNRRSARIKAQRLVLACAYFDEDGHLMVTQEGVLLSEKITNHYVEKVGFSIYGKSLLLTPLCRLSEKMNSAEPSQHFYGFLELLGIGLY